MIPYVGNQTQLTGEQREVSASFLHQRRHARRVALQRVRLEPRRGSHVVLIARPQAVQPIRVAFSRASGDMSSRMNGSTNDLYSPTLNTFQSTSTLSMALR